jgi:hypothetical protein
VGFIVQNQCKSWNCGSEVQNPGSYRGPELGGRFRTDRGPEPEVQNRVAR